MLTKIELNGISDGSTPKTVRENKGKSLLVFPDSYVVIDIETTGLDPRFDSIIEIAGIKCENGAETARFQSLVNPGYEIDEFITDLTGITNDMLKDAPSISEILPDFLDFTANYTIVGHNVNFDINFIYDDANCLKLAPFSNDFVDTMRLSRRLYKELKSHTLSSLTTHLDICDNVEHRALSDCICTQQCLEKMRLYAEENGGIPKSSHEVYSSLSKSITPETDNFDEDTPIFGMAFAFTGTLERMTRKEAMQAVANAGGIRCDRVTAATNYLVLGNNDFVKSLNGDKSSKQKKAEKMKQAGSDIDIISEDVFYDMLEA